MERCKCQPLKCERIQFSVFICTPNWTKKAFGDGVADGVADGQLYTKARIKHEKIQIGLIFELKIEPFKLPSLNNSQIYKYTKVRPLRTIAKNTKLFVDRRPRSTCHFNINVIVNVNE